MAVAGLAMYQNMSMNYSVRRDLRDFNPKDGGSFMNQMLTFHKMSSGMVQDADGNSVNDDREVTSELRFGCIQEMSPVGKYGELKPYTRCITANIKTKEMTASESDGEMIYSYQEEEKSFQIYINCDGENKTYTIKGTDENGQDIEEEFDPYNLDPEMMDFPEFSALCMYIRQTDETADLMTKMAFTDTSYFDGFFEKGDRVPMLKDYAEEYRKINPTFSELASSLYKAINDFFERTAWNKKISDDKVNRLLEDRDNEKVTTTDENQPEEVQETLTQLGMGFANAGSMGYGMSAALVTSSATDDIVVRVKVAKGGGNYVTRDVNLSEFDPKNATAVEMFAYCQYKDSIGEGSSHKWGSWNGIKSTVSPMDGMDFLSLDKIMNEKRNWTKALAGSKTHLENQKTKETLDAFDLMKMFEEQMIKDKADSEKNKDWRYMSDEEWNKLMYGMQASWSGISR